MRFPAVWIVACFNSRVTLPQIASQPSIPAPVLSGNISSGMFGKSARAGGSAAQGSSFAELLAGAASGTAPSVGSDPASAQSPVFFSKKQTSSSFETPGSPQAAASGSSIPAPKNFLAQLLAVRGNTAPGFYSGKPQLQQPAGTDGNASDSGTAAEETASATTGEQSGVIGKKISANAPNASTGLFGTPQGRAAGTQASLLKRQTPLTQSSETEHAAVVGSTPEQIQADGAAAESKVEEDEPEGSALGSGAAGTGTAVKRGQQELAAGTPALLGGQTRLTKSSQTEEAAVVGSTPGQKQATGATAESKVEEDETEQSVFGSEAPGKWTAMKRGKQEVAAGTSASPLAGQTRLTKGSQMEHIVVAGSTREQIQAAGARTESKGEEDETEQSALGSGAVGKWTAMKRGTAEPATSTAAQTPPILVSNQLVVGSASVPGPRAASHVDTADPATGDPKSIADAIPADAAHPANQNSKACAKTSAATKSPSEYKASPNFATIIVAPIDPGGKLDQAPGLPISGAAVATPSDSGANGLNGAGGNQPNPASITGVAAGSTAPASVAAPPPQDASIPATAAGPGATQTDHFAFALSASAAGQTPDRASGQPASAVNGTAKLTDGAASSVTPAAITAGSHGAATGTGVWQPGPVPAAAMQDRESRSAASPETVANAADVHAESKLPAPDALRSLRVQFTGANDQRVDVRVGNSGGELQVSVRSSDATLVQTLQDHMPELTSRLGEQHFHTEVWMPREATAVGTGGTRSGGSSFSGGNAYGQGQQGRRQNGQNSYKPAWIDDLEANPRRTQTLRRS